jgi:hypothetical protein
MKSHAISNTELIYQVKRKLSVILFLWREKLSIIHGTIYLMMYKRLELAYSLHEKKTQRAIQARLAMKFNPTHCNWG